MFDIALGVAIGYLVARLVYDILAARWASTRWSFAWTRRGANAYRLTLTLLPRSLHRSLDRRWPRRTTV